MFSLQRRKRFALIGALMALLAIGLLGGQLQDQSGQSNTQVSHPAVAKAGDRDAYSVNAGPAAPVGQPIGEDSHELLTRQEQWWQESTYPTGKIPVDAIANALRQDKLIPSGVPGGTVVYNAKGNASPLVLNPNGWTPLGPQPEQTDQCYNCYNYGPVSGRATDVKIDPTSPNIAYLASAGGSVWKTTNCCTPNTTWTLVVNNPAVAGSGVDAVEVDRNNHNVVYVGTGEANFAIDNFGAYGLLKSTDQGNNWTVLGTNVFTQATQWNGGGPYRYQAISKVKVDPGNSNNVAAATMNGLYFSYNAGSSWTGPCYTNSYFGSGQSEVMTDLILSRSGNSTTVYSAVGGAYSNTPNGANAVYSSTLGTSGCPANWHLLNNGWPAGTGNGTPSTDKPGRIDMDIAPSNPNVLYAEVSSQATDGLLGVYRTTDAGAHWTMQSGPDALDGCGFDYGQNWYDQDIRVDPNNPNVVFMDTFDIWKSTDGGVTWLDVACGYGGGTTIHVDQHGLDFAPGSSTTLMAVNDGGVYVTQNADVISPTIPTWNQLNNSLNTLQFYSGDTTGHFATSPNPGASGGTQDNGSSVAFFTQNDIGPRQWQMRVGGDGFYSRIEPVIGQHWYQGGNSGHIWVSPNGPNGPWNDVSAGWTAETRRFIVPFELAKSNCPSSGCQHLMVGSYRVWETVSGGLSASAWYTDSPRLTRNTGSSSYINELAFAPSDDSIAIVGTNDGYVQYGYGLGTGSPTATWVNISDNNTVLPNRAIFDVEIAPNNPLVGYAAVGSYNANTPSTPGHFFQATCTANCASVTWVNKTGNLPDVPAYSIELNPLYPQQAFVGTEWGLYFTNNVNANPPTWQRFDTGMPHVTVWDLTIDYGNTVLVAWTHGHGAFVWPLTSGPYVPPTVTITPTGTPPTATSTPSATQTGTPGPCFNYSVITGTATLVPALNDIGNHCDDCATTINLPFPVTFYDRTFQQGYASSDGAFVFGLATASLFNQCLPDRNESYSIVLYQNDLCTFGCGGATCPTCGIYTTTVGTAPNRQFIVEWQAIHYGVDEPPNTFEVVFQEGSSTVSTVYGVTSDAGANESIGVQQSADTRWTQYSCPTNPRALTTGLRVDYVPSACPTATPTVTATPCAMNFSDVHPTDYFYNDVHCIYCLGAISGYSDGTFRPYANTTRGQMTKIIVLALRIPIYTPTAGSTFSDVPRGSTFFDYVETAAHNQIVSGYSDGTFRPDTPVTRGQLSKIDAVAANHVFGWPLLNPIRPTFIDVPPENPFYTYIETVACHGVVSGYSDGTFRWGANAIRAQIAKIVCRTSQNPPDYCALTPSPVVMTPSPIVIK